MRAIAVVLTHGDDVALSHTSAAAVHGLRLHEPDLRRVHVTHLGYGEGGVTHDVAYHRGRVGDGELHRVDGVLVVGPVRAALEAATLHTVEPGLVLLDSVIDLGLGTVEDVWQRFHATENWPRTRVLQIVVRLVREGAGSVGETRIRYLCWSQRLPEPQLQFAVRAADGTLAALCDFAWPEHRLLGEFDGRVKYGRLLKKGQSASDAVFAEKRREDLVREITDWSMIRFVWHDCAVPQVTADRIRRLFRPAV